MKRCKYFEPLILCTLSIVNNDVDVFVTNTKDTSITF